MATNITPIVILKNDVKLLPYKMLFNSIKAEKTTAGLKPQTSPAPRTEMAIRLRLWLLVDEMYRMPVENRNQYLEATPRRISHPSEPFSNNGTKNSTNRTPIPTAFKGFEALSEIKTKFRGWYEKYRASSKAVRFNTTKAFTQYKKKNMILATINTNKMSARHIRRKNSPTSVAKPAPSISQLAISKALKTTDTFHNITTCNPRDDRKELFS